MTPQKREGSKPLPVYWVSPGGSAVEDDAAEGPPKDGRTVSVTSELGVEKDQAAGELEEHGWAPLWTPSL
jgi:hypothetical protein